MFNPLVTMWPNLFKMQRNINLSCTSLRIVPDDAEAASLSVPLEPLTLGITVGHGHAKGRALQQRLRMDVVTNMYQVSRIKGYFGVPDALRTLVH